ncbi:hypothetical protein KUTeg_010694 [Tegillarca granosa]|uniref:Uncharacterized protein n=1 Tax=Tegillarca granosa TaxID=220873 RepID=A0ABQ9F1Y0_TEGGR|nr:hypothetical protein KUTeg_010694 [Tegillarca granosa]
MKRWLSRPPPGNILLAEIKYFHCNFGINMCLFDWLHDTIRHEDRIYGEDVFGGHGRPKILAIDKC